ncbi:MAG TPA: radical SAM protein [Candidatus Saccharimonadales bacterium]|nr:radical SAM protein [Candidatus Saccharimonadales bacterium]
MNARASIETRPANPTGVAPVLHLHPTRRGNLACAHGYTSSSPGTSEDLPLELLSACLAEAADLGYRQLALSGGEPLLYPALDELLVRARALGMRTSLTSDGTLISERSWSKLAPWIDVIAISIDGRSAEHDALRRRPGALASTVANLAHLRASGAAFGFIFTLTQHNVDSLEFVVLLAATEGARSVQVHPLTLRGRAVHAFPQAYPDSEELRVALLEAARLGRELGVAVHVDALTIQQLCAYRSYLVPQRPIDSLTDVAPVLIVEPDGRVLPFTRELNPAFQLGSLHEATLTILAERWLASGRADRLAGVCERTWEELSGWNAADAVCWSTEVAARTYPAGGPFADVDTPPHEFGVIGSRAG